ncbi:MAG: hypothetical protein M0P71_08290 [Melioribacteraceae bacterium]|nr:hypothetical protein [Melioribacteraceae bacterium]
MNQNNYNIDDSLLEKIISVAYDDANFLDKIKITYLASKYSNVKKLLDEYKHTANEVHSIELEEFPNSSLEKVFSQLELNKEKQPQFWSDIYTVFIKRPSLVYSLSLLLILTITVSIFVKREPNTSQFSKEEVVEADKQTREALYIVATIFNDAQTQITEDVIKEKIAAPLNQSLGILNNIINKEKQQ